MYMIYIYIYIFIYLFIYVIYVYIDMHRYTPWFGFMEHADFNWWLTWWFKEIRIYIYIHVYMFLEKSTFKLVWCKLWWSPELGVHFQTIWVSEIGRYAERSNIGYGVMQHMGMVHNHVPLVSIKTTGKRTSMSILGLSEHGGKPGNLPSQLPQDPKWI